MQRDVLLGVHANGVPHTALNPPTPPLSDGSNYSTTPSPNAVQLSFQGQQPVVLKGPPLPNSSVMLSPQETYAGYSPGNGYVNFVRLFHSIFKIYRFFFCVV